jgi:hypothetical protein
MFCYLELIKILIYKNLKTKNTRKFPTLYVTCRRNPDLSSLDLSDPLEREQ